MEASSAMILAGGWGQRMGILCRNKAKVILPFAGNVRVIDFTLSNCIYSELGDIAVLTDCQRSAMAIYLEEKAEIRNSIVMANSFIGYHSVVDRCILDEAVNLESSYVK